MAKKTTTSKTAKAPARGASSQKDVTSIKTNLKTANVKTPKRPATNPSMPQTEITEIGQLLGAVYTV